MSDFGRIEFFLSLQEHAGAAFLHWIRIKKHPTHPILLPQLYKAVTQQAPKADIPHQPSVNKSTCSCSMSSSSFRTFHSTISYTHPTSANEDHLAYDHMKAVQSKGIKLSSSGSRLVSLSQSIQPKPFPWNHSILALWPAMSVSSISGGIFLLGYHCFFHALQAGGKGNEVPPSQLPETTVNPTLLRVYSPSSAAGKRLFLTWSSCPKEEEDGNSWNSTVGKQQTETLRQAQHSSPLSPLISLSQKKLRHFWFAVTTATVTAALMPSTSSFMPLVTCIGIQWGLWGLKKNFSLFSKDTVHHSLTWKLKQDISRALQNNQQSSYWSLFRGTRTRRLKRDIRVPIRTLPPYQEAQEKRQQRALLGPIQTEFYSTFSIA